ncbi:hypothetical protein BJ912DRAFT_1042978, partial [Pholiota molesta]
MPVYQNGSCFQLLTSLEEPNKYRLKGLGKVPFVVLNLESRPDDMVAEDVDESPFILEIRNYVKEEVIVGFENKETVEGYCLVFFSIEEYAAHDMTLQVGARSLQ